MQTEIDNYRGYEIRFDTSYETFLCDIDDDRSVKKSYSAIKKFIDEYLKENNGFKPFKIVPNPLEAYYNDKPATVIGIRKDKTYQIQLEDGTKKQLSSYDEKKYWVSTPDILAEIERVNPVLEEIKRLESLVSEQEKIKNSMYKAIVAVDVRTKKQMHNG